jgi:hypothetical protein
MAVRHATQGGGDVTKGDAKTSHRSEQEANERRKAQADKRRHGDDEEGHVVLLSGGGRSDVCPWALMAIHRAYCDDGSGPLVMATGGGGRGGGSRCFRCSGRPPRCSHTLLNASCLLFADCCVGALVGYVVQKGLRSQRHPKI